GGKPPGSRGEGPSPQPWEMMRRDGRRWPGGHEAIGDGSRQAPGPGGGGGAGGGAGPPASGAPGGHPHQRRGPRRPGPVGGGPGGGGGRPAGGPLCPGARAPG